MKYILVIADGMADSEQELLGGMTPLAYANTKTLDSMAQYGEIGRVQTIPKGMEAGSDVAGLTILGYHAYEDYKGRGSLELLGLEQEGNSIELGEYDIVYRMNLVQIESMLNNKFAEKYMRDHTAGQISTENAKKSLEKLKKLFDRMGFQYYTETSYRHLLVGKSKSMEYLTPPHNILGKKIGSYLPKDRELHYLIKESHRILELYLKKEEKNQKKTMANSIWLWGGGSQYHLKHFFDKYKKRGAMISAVAVLKGIANGCGMVNLTVKEATGTVHTNYKAKANRAITALLEEQYDFICVHIEGTDEASHRGDILDKIYGIEQIDKNLLAPIVEKLKEQGEDFRLLFLPDHYTLVQEKIHTDEPVPYLLYDSRSSKCNQIAYNEKQGKLQPLLSDGTKLIQKLFSE